MYCTALRCDGKTAVSLETGERGHLERVARTLTEQARAMTCARVPLLCDSGEAIPAIADKVGSPSPAHASCKNRPGR